MKPASTSSLPIPFWTLHTAPSAKIAAAAAVAPPLVATMPSAQGAISAGSVVARTGARIS
jgi:hypothetical protein